MALSKPQGLPLLRVARYWICRSAGARYRQGWPRRSAAMAARVQTDVKSVWRLHRGLG
jgi:hypothetical protein